MPFCFAFSSDVKTEQKPRRSLGTTYRGYTVCGLKMWHPLAGGKNARTGKTGPFFGTLKARTKILRFLRRFRHNLLQFYASTKGAN